MARHGRKKAETKLISIRLEEHELNLSRFSLSLWVDGGWRRQDFEDGPVRIGAHPENELCITGDSTVSRFHCLIFRQGDTYVLEDLESTNGTHTQGVQVRQIYLDGEVDFVVGQSKVRFAMIRESAEILPSMADRLGRIVGASVKMRALFGIIEKVARTDTTVIIEGETGTGKEVVAQTLHERSLRSEAPFIVFDCSAVPQNLIESELFGHEKGSFTGAVMSRAGLFERANGGTIFLDELGELGIELQPKLLRLLETRKVRRVGASRMIPVDVRVIAATNRRLEDEVRAGRFRQDLYYRLCVVRLTLPPLRERLGDIPLLVAHILERSHFNKDADGSRRVTLVDDEVYDRLGAYHWPGNVRELVNTLERACSFAEHGRISLADLSPQVLGEEYDAIQLLSTPHTQGDSSPRPQNANPWRDPNDRDALEDDAQESSGEAVDAARVLERLTTGEIPPFKEAKEEWISFFERDYVLSALQKHGYNISHASRAAEIDRKYFRKLIGKHEIELP